MKFLLFPFITLFSISVHCLEIHTAPAFNFFEMQDAEENKARNTDKDFPIVKIFSPDGTLQYSHIGASNEIIKVLDNIQKKANKAKKTQSDYLILRKKYESYSVKLPAIESFNGEFKYLLLSVEFEPSGCSICTVQRGIMETIEAKFGSQIKVVILELDLP